MQLGIWLLAPVVPFLVTAHPRFLFLGEAERYLEYAVVPAAVLTATVVAIAPVLLDPRAISVAVTRGGLRVLGTRAAGPSEE